tara:strand:- start:4315 stop:4962 length:648 start_codon:yes stop_codon:yes gene_type:complete
MPIKVGSSEMTKLYVGSTEISKAYKGSDQVFPSSTGTTTTWVGDSETIGSLESQFGGTNGTYDPTKSTHSLLRMHIDQSAWSGGSTPSISTSGFGSAVGWNVDMGVTIKVMTPGQSGGGVQTADTVHATWTKAEDSSTALNLVNGWWQANSAYSLSTSTTAVPNNPDSTYPRLRQVTGHDLMVDINFASIAVRDSFATEIGTGALVRVTIEVTTP